FDIIDRLPSMSVVGDRLNCEVEVFIDENDLFQQNEKPSKYACEINVSADELGFPQDLLSLYLLGYTNDWQDSMSMTALRISGIAEATEIMLASHFRDYLVSVITKKDKKVASED
ncbi:7440_t:CDS:2, partial [Paraglomus brasilianum]